VISPTQKPLLENTQYLQEANFNVPGGFRTHIPSMQAAADPRLRPRGIWDRLFVYLVGMVEDVSTRMHGREHFKTVCHSWAGVFFHFIETFVRVSVPTKEC
jgi:hypothetical protein